MGREAVRDRREPLDERRQNGRFHRRLDFVGARLRAAGVAAPIPAEPVLDALEILASRDGELLLEKAPPLDRDLIDLFAADAPELQEVLEVAVAHADSLGDGAIE